MAEDPFIIETLGKATIENPIARLGRVQFIDEDDRILQQPFLKNLQSARDQGITPASFPEAGPSRHIFFGPEGTRAAVVTCGGLCPGRQRRVRFRRGARDSGRRASVDGRRVLVERDARARELLLQSEWKKCRRG